MLELAVRRYALQPGEEGGGKWSVVSCVGLVDARSVRLSSLLSLIHI